jgi:hypothetical protein
MTTTHDQDEEDRRLEEKLRLILPGLVKQGITEAFGAVGINTEDVGAQIEAQKDMAFLRGLRVKTGVFVMTIIAGLGSIALNIWHWVQTMLPAATPPHH